MRGWRPLLRLAWRDVLRSKGRSALVLTLIALPVLAVTVALTVMATAEVTGTEALERRLGGADARLSFDGSRRVAHEFDPEAGMTVGEGAGRALTAAEIAELLGRDVRAIEWGESQLAVRTDSGATSARVTHLDLADPLAEGLARLEGGRLPASPGEALVNGAFSELGVELGETLTLADGTTLEVVGIGEDASQKALPQLFTPPPTEAAPPRLGTWLVQAGDVTWPEVRALNEQGARVLSRAVLLDPPPSSELPTEISEYSSDDAVFAVVVLVVVMVLLEVVLLAGPAFAVTARRQARTLALMAAVGGTPAQARRTILSVAVVLGGLAALIGVVGGILIALLVAVPVAEHFSSSWFGPFDVPWTVLVVAAFGVVSALLAAVVPAHLTSRMNVVAVLAGRRGEASTSVRTPLLGLALLGAGIAGAVVGANLDYGGEVPIAGSAIVSVLGMILLVPVVLSALARLAAPLPLPLRYAVRDAVRHRTRTVPAVAAVAATVCGVVALGISTSSDAKQDRETYTAELAHGDAIARVSDATPEQWVQVEERLRRELPGATITPVVGVPESFDNFVDVSYRTPGDDQLLEWSGGTVGTMNVVGDEIPAVLHGLSAAERRRGDEALAAGRVVVFARHAVEADTVRIKAEAWDQDAGRRKTLFGPATLEAAYVEVEGSGFAVAAVVPTAVAEELGMESGVVSVQVTGTAIGAEQRETIEEAVAGFGAGGDFYVERGYVAEIYQRLVLWVLGGLGAVLMLGGTLTVTFLALSDARPDLATLSAVGAAPRTRRAVAASYALVVGFVGAVLGALVGLVPGIAVTYPLTRTEGSWTIEGEGMTAVSGEPPTIGPFLEIPWLMIAAVVIGLPLLTALVVAAATRSRLPMVARLD